MPKAGLPGAAKGENSSPQGGSLKFQAGPSAHTHDEEDEAEQLAREVDGLQWMEVLGFPALPPAENPLADPWGRCQQPG